MKNNDKLHFTRIFWLLMILRQNPTGSLSGIREDVMHRLHRSGGVVGISGGIDSSVSLALAAKALGPENVLGIMLPEKDSSPDSALFGHRTG